MTEINKDRIDINSIKSIADDVFKQSGKVVIAEFMDEEDDTIEYGNYHIQVGSGYVGITKELDDETFLMSDYVTNLKSFRKLLKEFVQ